MRLHPLVVGLLALCGASASAATLPERLEVCLACHGEKGQSETPEVPSLGAQPPLFLSIELFMFRNRQRRVEIMNDVAKDLTDADLNALAEHLAKQPPPQPSGVVIAPSHATADVSHVGVGSVWLACGRHEPTFVGAGFETRAFEDPDGIDTHCSGGSVALARVVMRLCVMACSTKGASATR